MTIKVEQGRPMTVYTDVLSQELSMYCTISVEGLMMTMQVEQGRPMTAYTDILSQELSMYCTISVERVNDDHTG